MNPNEETISNLRDKVADIKYDTQQVLDRIDSLDAAYQEMTGMEQSLLKRQKQDAVAITQLKHDVTAKEVQASAWKAEVDKLKVEVQRQQDLGQGYYDSMMTFKAEVDKLRSEKEASSGPCGCQAYRDLEEARGRAEGEVELLQRTIADLEERATMPVIPKDVAIAIFREGVQSGVNDAVAELEGQSIDIEESEYCGDFEVSFSRHIDLDDELDLDWMRGKVGQYNEEFVVDALKGLCADDEVKFTIEGLKEQETNK